MASKWVVLMVARWADSMVVAMAAKRVVSRDTPSDDLMVATMAAMMAVWMDTCKYE